MRNRFSVLEQTLADGLSMGLSPSQVLATIESDLSRSEWRVVAFLAARMRAGKSFSEAVTGDSRLSFGIRQAAAQGAGDGSYEKAMRVFLASRTERVRVTLRVATSLYYPTLLAGILFSLAVFGRLIWSQDLLIDSDIQTIFAHPTPGSWFASHFGLWSSFALVSSISVLLIALATLIGFAARGRLDSLIDLVPGFRQCRRRWTSVVDARHIAQALRSGASLDDALDELGKWSGRTRWRQAAARIRKGVPVGGALEGCGMTAGLVRTIAVSSVASSAPESLLEYADHQEALVLMKARRLTTAYAVGLCLVLAAAIAALLLSGYASYIEALVPSGGGLL
ncbi:MAG: type II secretion system F family protein [Myxococcales bacterium]|nr:type II secretion system F family protein [Myxococcales bacterium]